MKKTLILKKNVNEIIFKYIECDTDNYYNISCDGILFKIIRKLKIKNIPYILGKWKKNIANYDEIILFDTGYYQGVGNYIKKHNKKCKTYLYYWNPINMYNKGIKDDKNIDDVYTFDENDAKNYNIKYNAQFYTRNITLKEKQIINDVVFLGRVKSRKEAIKNIEKVMKENEISTKFYVIESEKDLIEYQEYLDVVAETKAILDIVETNQSGLTLKSMEALFFKKKLITNNQKIKNYNFYNKENIFIIGEDDNKKLNEFINSDYKEIDEEIVDGYDFKNWLRRFQK